LFFGDHTTNHKIRWNQEFPSPFSPPRRRPGACGVSEAAASACHDTMLGAKAPGRLQTTL
jgi:hypothetical protein